MENNLRLRSLMDSTNAVLLCLLIFIVRATITVWPSSGRFTQTYCVLAVIACVTGVITNAVAKKLAVPRSSN